MFTATSRVPPRTAAVRLGETKPETFLRNKLADKVAPFPRQDSKLNGSSAAFGVVIARVLSTAVGSVRRFAVW